MQSLVYIFIALACLGIGGAAYFGFTFSPIEAFVTALAFGAIAVMLLERTLRQRSEARLEKGIEDLSRLLSTNAQAGAVLAQRVNAIADQNSARRMEGLEADISVLGTVIRQVAEAVAELEESTGRKTVKKDEEPDPDTFPEPVVSLQELRKALDEDRLLCHVEPVIQLPQRRPAGQIVVPRLMLEDGQLMDPPDFMPRRDGVELVRRIEATLLGEAVAIVRRARTAGRNATLYVPLSGASLTDPASLGKLMASLEANRAIASSLLFSITQADFRKLGPAGRGPIAAISEFGIGLSLADATSLRIDFAELQNLGFRSIRLDAGRFIEKPESFSDFHTSDIAAYGRRFSIELIAGGITTEQQVLGLLEDGLTLVHGPYLGGVGPAQIEPAALRNAAPAQRRAEA